MNPTGKDLLQRKIEYRNLVILGIMLLVSLLAMPTRFTLGILVGGVISIINLYWLGRDLRVIFSNLSGTAKSAMMIRYYIRMAATAVVLYFVITETARRHHWTSRGPVACRHQHRHHGDDRVSKKNSSGGG